MDAFVGVDELRHTEINADTAEHIGVLGREPCEFAQELDHLPERLLGGVVEILVEAERDPMGRRLRPRHVELEVLAQDELESSAERGFERRGADLTVALHAVPVAYREERAS